MRDASRRALEEIRWPAGPVCPRCESTDASPIKDRPTWSCRSCRKQFSVRLGTVLEDSRLPLWKWFFATYLICEAKKGVSSNQLKRTLGVSYKSAWYLTHRIRAAMGDGAQRQLRGIVEADETFIHPRRYRYARTDKDGMRFPKMGPRPGEKVVILGAVERGGEMRLRLAANRTNRTIDEFLIAEVADDSEVIYTDEHGGYRGLADGNTRHETVTHAEKEWVRGDVHTNTAESVWSLLNRSIVGSYHHLSVKHLPAYLDELEWRFNNRNNPYLFRDTPRSLVSSETMEYSELTAD